MRLEAETVDGLHPVQEAGKEHLGGTREERGLDVGLPAAPVGVDGGLRTGHGGGHLGGCSRHRESGLGEAHAPARLLDQDHPQFVLQGLELLRHGGGRDAHGLGRGPDRAAVRQFPENPQSLEIHEQRLQCGRLEGWTAPLRRTYRQATATLPYGQKGSAMDWIIWLVVIVVIVAVVWWLLNRNSSRGRSGSAGSRRGRGRNRRHRRFHASPPARRRPRPQSPRRPVRRRFLARQRRRPASPGCPRPRASTRPNPEPNPNQPPTPLPRPRTGRPSRPT